MASEMSCSASPPVRGDSRYRAVGCESVDQGGASSGTSIGLEAEAARGRARSMSTVISRLSCGQLGHAAFVQPITGTRKVHRSTHAVTVGRWWDKGKTDYQSVTTDG